jgi:Domain of unknown function (DUF4224)
MDTRLMSEDDLKHITGKKRHGAQAAWFELHFGVRPVQSADGRIIMTWAAFEILQAKRAGVSPASVAPRPQLRPIGRAA